MPDASKIELNVYDLCIKTLDDGTDICQIVGRLAFEPNFVEAMRQKGVQKYIKREKD
jgi:hypothetical protein